MGVDSRLDQTASRTFALETGRLIDLFYDEDVYVFARQNSRETIIIAMNSGKKDKQVAIPAGAIGLKDGAQITSLSDPSTSGPVISGAARLAVGSRTAVAYAIR